MGQDGTRLAEIHRELDAANRVVEQECILHVIGEDIEPDARIAELVAAERAPFVAGNDFRAGVWVNPFNGSTLQIPIDSVAGQTEVDLHRMSVSDDPVPAVIEGTSHNFLTDAFREEGQADIGQIRGFRYGTHVPAGPVHLEDLYHFIPIGPTIGVGTITGAALRDQIEESIDGSLNPDPFQWSGGWIFGYSGVRYDLDVYGAKGSRARNIRVQRYGTDAWEPLETPVIYTIAGYVYASNPAHIGGVTSLIPPVVLGDPEQAVDATDVVVRYLETHRAHPDVHRIRLLRPLPRTTYGIPEIQPLRGVSGSGG